MKKLLIFLLVFFILGACSKQQKSTAKNQSQTFIIIKKTSGQNHFYYDGTITPIKSISVSSPLDGNIDTLNFSYGLKVKKGQLLVSLKSADLGKNYQQALSAYLTAKEKYTTSKSQIIGAKDLYDSGITSKQTYQAAVSDLNDSYLDFLQAQQALLEVLASAGINEKDIYLLQIGEEKAVKKALTAPLKTINLYAPDDGVALKPEKSSTSDSASSFHKGSEVKAGQAIVTLGTMSGIKIDVNVDEISINSIEVGDHAIITSPAFPNITLMGSVSAVGYQANTDSDDGSSLPTFPVTVIVNNLTAAEQDIIHVGMSAKIEIQTNSPAEIVIPIDAVHMGSQGTYVNVMDPQTKKLKQVLVQTGATTVDGVMIISGLKPGDKIVSGY